MNKLLRKKHRLLLWSTAVFHFFSICLSFFYDRVSHNEAKLGDPKYLIRFFTYWSA